MPAPRDGDFGLPGRRRDTGRKASGARPCLGMGTSACLADGVTPAAKRLEQGLAPLLLAIQRMSGLAPHAQEQDESADVFHIGPSLKAALDTARLSLRRRSAP